MKIPHWQAESRVKNVTYPLSQQPMGTSREAGRPSFQIREALLERGETEGAAVDHLEGEAWIVRLKSVADEVDSLNRINANQELKIMFTMIFCYSLLSRKYI